MYKLLIFISCVLIAACTAFQKNEESYVFSSSSEIPPAENSSFATQNSAATQRNASDQTQIAPATQNTVSPSKTYMAEMAKKLKKAASNTNFIIKQYDNKIVMTMPTHVVFGSNKTTLDEQIEPILADMARTIKEYDRTRIQIFGYTDNTITVSEAKELTLKQANAVSNFWRLNGVDINRIIVDGLGPDNPVASNTTPLNRRKNRRIEVTFINIQ